MSNKIPYYVMSLLLCFMVTAPMADGQSYPDCTKCDLCGEKASDPPDGICKVIDARVFFHQSSGWGQPPAAPGTYKCDIYEDGVCNALDSGMFRELYLRGACQLGIVECDLVPDEPDPVVARGEFLSFDLWFHNKTVDTQDFGVYANVTLPNYSKVPPSGYLRPVGLPDVSLAAGAEQAWTLDLGPISPGAPLGTYKYNVYAGQLGRGLIEKCCLEFVVVEVDDDECVECTLSSECGPGEYCKKAVGDCEGTGCCAPRPSLIDCERVPNTVVCGCKWDTVAQEVVYKTFADYCEAARRGMNVACEGRCPCQ
jgi:hypothetical protein